jgi:hypothetical protein
VGDPGDGQRAEKCGSGAAVVKSSADFGCQKLTYTFPSVTLHSLQRVYRDWNERVRELLLAGGGRWPPPREFDLVRCGWQELIQPRSGAFSSTRPRMGLHSSYLALISGLVRRNAWSREGFVVYCWRSFASSRALISPGLAPVAAARRASMASRALMGASRPARWAIMATSPLR